MATKEQLRKVKSDPLDKLDASVNHFTISVIIAAFSLERLPLLIKSVESITRQSHRADEIIIVIDNNERLFDIALNKFSGDKFLDCKVIKNEGQKGLSSARNTGVLASKSEIVAFLDDDAYADDDWLFKLTAPYKNPLTAGTGGLVIPKFVTKTPDWLPEEFYWTIGCSYKGLPGTTSPIRNPIGASMSYRRQLLIEAGLFDVDMGRIGKTPLGCEETEAAIRICQLQDGMQIIYCPESIVSHSVPQERCTINYFLRRCYLEGVSKSMVTRRVGSSGLKSETKHAFVNIPAAIVRNFALLVTKERKQSLKVLALITGLFATSLGYLRGLIWRKR